MKRIYHSETLALVWRGDEYLVDGVPGPVEPPLVLAVEHGINDAFDPATETRDWVDRPALLIGQWELGWEKRALTPEEIAARQPQPQPVTKLTLMRRLGPKWATLKYILSQQEEVVQDAWQLAQEISPHDGLFLQHADSLKAALELSDEEFTSLFLP